MPNDTYEPKKHENEELDALKIPLQYRDGCGDYYAEYKKCIGVVHQTRSSLQWKRAEKDNCLYYLDHWAYCREKKCHTLGMSVNMNGL